MEFVQSHDGDAAKLQLFRDVRAGKVRILFGSTQKMGTGANVQERLIALHHLDAPWRPADVEQREGRILRQGNTNPDRDAGWDLTFSVPKAVSVLWAMSPPSVRAEIEAAQRDAVKTALGLAEEIFGFTRRGQGGKRHEHAALLFAAFEEYVLRAKAFQSILRNRVQRGGVLADRAGLIRTGASGSGVESRAVSHHETRKDPSCICSPEELNQWLPSS
jgi:hypothetical protein